MKKKMLMIPLMALLVSCVVSGCYTSRPYDPYYHNREYKYKHRHHHDRYYDHDREDYGYRH